MLFHMVRFVVVIPIYTCYCLRIFSLLLLFVVCSWQCGCFVITL